MSRFPIWIFPASIVVFFFFIIFWMLFTDKMPSKKTLGTKKITKESPIDIKDLPQGNKQEITYVPSLKEEMKTEKRKSLKESSPSDQYYSKGILHFENSDYQNASYYFLNYLKFTESAPSSKTINAKIYLAYSMMFLGMRENNSHMIEKSHKRFIEVYKEISSRNKLYPRVILGLAKTSRLIKDYPEGLDIFLKESLVLADQQLKKHLYLELGYYYFYENNLDNALFYFEKSNLPIANQKFFDVLLKKDGTSLYILSLFSKNMIPKDLTQEMKNKIQAKVLEEARRDFKNSRKEEGVMLLKKLIFDFPKEPITEDANFYLADFYAQDLQYQKALYYFDQVLSNEFLDLDSAAVLKKGIIYYRLGNYRDAMKNFNNIRENYVSSKYYQAAIDWIREIEKIQGEINTILKEPKREKEKPTEDLELLEEQPIKTKKAPREKKQSGSKDDDLFLKEELPDDELY